MQLAQLHMVKQILETGSLSKTAIRMNWAQSVVSRQLAAFERECGGRIFYRNGRGVVLTELGERVLPQIDVIIAAAEDITGCGAELRQELAGEVKVAIGPQIARYLTGRMLRELKQAHPNLRLAIWEAYNGTRADLLEGRTDIAVFMHTCSNLGAHDRVIAELDTYIVGLPDSPATAKPEVDFGELANHPLLLPSLPNPWRRAFDQVAARKEVTLSIAAEVNAPVPATALVHSGIGYLVVPLMQGTAAARVGGIGADVHAGKLRASRIIDPGFKSHLLVATGTNRRPQVTAVARLIEDLLRELVEPVADDEVNSAIAPELRLRLAS